MGHFWVEINTLFKPGLKFEPVFDYEQVLVVAKDHPLASTAYVKPQQLTREVLISYPVDIERLDIYSQFLLPAGVTPKRHKAIETTDIMVQMVASGRGVAALAGRGICGQDGRGACAAGRARYCQADLPGRTRGGYRH